MLAMKTLFFAAALALSGAAVAQTGNTVNDPSQSTGPRGVTQQGTSPNGQACTPPGYNAGGGGYPPCGSDMAGGATAGGATSGGGMSGGAMSGAAGTGGTGMAMAGSLPPCSRTVTDRCTQTYERGVAGARRR
jgi:hypothetical protein